ncbi:MAG: dihydropteroate synthase [Ilumatobacteraceae bacterium]
MASPRFGPYCGVDLRLATRTLTLERVRLMGIVNVTPDSFSDGGRFLATDDAVRHVQRLIDEGADIIDIGGESTRPGASPVSVAEELDRVVPVVERAAPLGVPISIDTRHAAVAEAAIAAGAVMINDIAGLRDRAMRSVAVCHQVPVVLMHMPIDDPSTMQQHTDYDDVVHDVTAFLHDQAERALGAGVPQVVVDPGIGFGKTGTQNLELIRRLDEIVALGHPVLAGASRKQFVGNLTGVADPAERVAGTLAVHLAAVARGARLLRVHDVAAHRQALDVWESIAPPN